MNATDIPMHRRRLAAGLVGLAVLMGSAVSQQASAQTLIDYDTDDDNLIEVDSLAKLNAIRYDLDGNGSSNANYRMAFPTPATSMGCQATCTGYELMTDLNFDTSGDDAITNEDDSLSWGSGSGWQPIGTSTNRFTAEFHGNGHTISHLFINRPTLSNVGLFGATGSGAAIRGVGLVGVNVTGNDNTGSLIGFNAGTIDASYATGEISGDERIGGLVGTNVGTINASYTTVAVNGNITVGGLVGQNSGSDGEGVIRASYATGTVNGDLQVGGLIGLINSGGMTLASYATGAVSGNTQVGGLIGARSGGIETIISDSYYNTETVGSSLTLVIQAQSKTTDELRSPMSYTGIYANWNVDLDGDSTIDDPWDFGTNEQYPVLQVDFDGDGVKSWEEFGPQQSRPGVFVSPEELFLMEGEAGAYTVVLLSEPTASVMVTPVSDDPAVSVSGSLTFMMGNWDTEQTVTVQAEEDDSGVDEVVSLTHTVTGGDYASVTVRDVTVSVTDPDPGVAVSPGTLSLTEGTTGSYTVVLLTTPTAMVTVTPVSTRAETVSVSGELTFTMDNWDTEQTVTASAAYDMNTANEEVELMHTVDSTDSVYMSVTPPVVTVNVMDNGAGIDVSPGSLSLREGATGAYTLVLLTMPTAMVTVTPESENTTAVSVSNALIFMPNEWNTAQTVTVRAEDDDNADNEMVSLTHMVTSTDPNYNTQVIAPAVTVDVTDDDDGIRVRVRVFLEGPLR